VTRAGPMTRYEKRLGALFQRHGLCPVHVERPVCVRCDFEWVGTAAEEHELEALLDRAWGGAPFAPPALWCRSCGNDWAVCLSCLESEMAQHPLPTEDLLSPEERARHDTLARHLRPTRRRGRDPDVG
jgi:hypothetical protein